MKLWIWGLNSTICYIFNGGFKEIKHIKDLLKICDPSGIAISSALHYKIHNKFQLNVKNDGNTEFLEKNDSFFIEKNKNNPTLKKIKKKFNI